MIFCQFFIIKLEKLQILWFWLRSTLFEDFLLFSFCLSYRETQLFRNRFTDLKIFFYTITCKIWWLRLILIFFLAWWLFEHSYTTLSTFSDRSWFIKPWSFADTFTLRFFVFVFAWAGGFFFFAGFGLIIRNMFFCSVSIEQLLFLWKWKSLPFLNNFRDQLRFSHPWELMTIFVVLLTRKLSVQFCQLFLF